MRARKRNAKMGGQRARVRKRNKKERKICWKVDGKEEIV